MRYSGVELPDLAEALKRRGFDYVRPIPSSAELEFIGTLKANKQEHPCRLLVPKALDDVPTIWLTDMEAHLPLLRPHLSASGYLCYIAHGAHPFDSFSPIGQTLGCIARAERVLSSILRGEMVDDLADEFYAHWGELFCLSDVQPNSGKREYVFEVSKNGRVWYVLSDDKDRTDAKIKLTLGASLELKMGLLLSRVKTAGRPIPYQQDWPPKTVGELLNWQKSLDLDCAKIIERNLTAMTRVGAKKAIVTIESPKLTYGFSTTIPQRVRRKKKPVPVRAELHRQKIVPLQLYRIDNEYIAERNLPAGKTLIGLEILLVGCGTIGGYLADMLVKAGAGTGGGRLVLVDKDSLGPQNIGRHRLGLDAVFFPKVHALGTELSRISPGARIEGAFDDIKRVNPGKVSLVIDATGEQALSDWVTWKYLREAAVLTVWVEGAGLAVRGLLKDQVNHACTRCISKPPLAGQVQVFKEPTEVLLKGHGCEGLYVPFPASASLQAAALGMEMVQAWVDGVTAPTLRTRVLVPDRELMTPDCTPLKAEGCPVCDT